MFFFFFLILRVVFLLELNCYVWSSCLDHPKRAQNDTIIIYPVNLPIRLSFWLRFSKCQQFVFRDASLWIYIFVCFAQQIMHISGMKEHLFWNFKQSNLATCFWKREQVNSPQSKHWIEHIQHDPSEFLWSVKLIWIQFLRFRDDLLYLDDVLLPWCFCLCFIDNRSKIPHSHHTGNVCLIQLIHTLLQFFWITPWSSQLPSWIFFWKATDSVFSSTFFSHVFHNETQYWHWFLCAHCLVYILYTQKCMCECIGESMWM